MHAGSKAGRCDVETVHAQTANLQTAAIADTLVTAANASYIRT